MTSTSQEVIGKIERLLKELKVEEQIEIPIKCPHCEEEFTLSAEKLVPNPYYYLVYIVHNYYEKINASNFDEFKKKILEHVENFEKYYTVFVLQLFKKVLEFKEKAKEELEGRGGELLYEIYKILKE